MKRDSIGGSGVSDEALRAYFDGEVNAEEAAELRRTIEGNADLMAELEQLGVMRDLTAASLRARADEVPQARFEQIWDEIDRAIEADARAQAKAAEGSPSLWERLWAAVKPVRYPLLAAGAAALVAVVLIQSGDDPTAAGPALAEEKTNKTHEGASVTDEPDGAPPAPSSESSKSVPTPVPPDAIAARPTPVPDGAPSVMVPQAGEADIKKIDSEGNVRISHTGTITVVYVEEDVEAEDSERSL